MKHLIAIVDANAQHRSMVADALLSFYTVNPYDNSANAISGMLLARPKLILVGHQVGMSSGANFVRDLRKEKMLSEIPVILIVDSQDFRVVDAMRALGINDYLVKPYYRSALINAISKQLNGQVEHSWQDLPVAQRKALDGTLGTFNSIADDIANGTPLSYGAINESCAALVEVVTKEELGSFLHKIKDHDNFTYVHSLRFSTLMSLFGNAIGLPKAQQIQIASGGMLHDIGKMTIPRELLNKQGTLTPSEWKIMRGHVATAQKILATTDAIPKGVSMIVTQHHERLDGSGYPCGLKAPELNELARMAAIIDVFCALTDRRPYRRAVAAHVALETMGIEMRNQLDQDLLFKFREILLETGGVAEEPEKVA
jgi:HD-GYP domain-containing protein (c-di-GMP phosphodiesterase class II)